MMNMMKQETSQIVKQLLKDKTRLGGDALKQSIIICLAAYTI